MGMGVLLNNFLNSFIFWAAWISIPMIMEILPSLGSFFLLLKRLKKYDQKTPPTLYPEISIIIPIYNSAETLDGCLRSINDCSYPSRSIRIFLVNNLTRDNSFEIFTQCQERYPELHMQWLNAQQGKSRALNLALYNSEGKYIVHIDSDGLLEKDALTNLVDLFESDLTCNCVTGTILTDPEKVEEFTGFDLLIRRLEFMEYAQAFLAGRNYASETNAIYTLSGAFSAFRKSAILKSWLYNTDTICEDTQLTFQMRYIQKETVRISVDSIFLTDPIEDLDKLYTQRQRWQRGSLEVSKMFMDTDKLNPLKMFNDVNVKTLMYDHTFAFPRMIWYLATICMVFMGFSGKTILTATAMLFGMYTICGYFYFAASCSFLKKFPDLHDYYKKNWWIIPLLPFFNLMVFFIRLAGIVNSIGTDSAWKTRTFTQERQSFRDTLKSDFSHVARWIGKVRDGVNCDPEVRYAPKTLDQRLRGSFPGYLATLLTFLAAACIFVVSGWTSRTFHLTFGDILAFSGSPDPGALSAMLWTCLPLVLLALIPAVCFVILDRVRTRRVMRLPESFIRQDGAKWVLRLRQWGVAATCLLLAGSLVYANACYGVTSFAAGQLMGSAVYEEHYVDPREVAILPPAQPKNLIYICLEGMESSFACVEDGGLRQEGCIPNLTRLAQENLSFSPSGAAPGGLYTNYGATQTMSALYTAASGVHYALPANEELLTQAGRYASGLTTLGDVLAENGYQNQFLCGSTVTFADKGAFLRQHGDYQIFDFRTAVERGLADPADEAQGMEDAKVYACAKEELTRLSQSGRPFNLTILTSDTRSPGGHVCPLCPEGQEDEAVRVTACADGQVGAFVDWCREQPFFDQTVIVLVGDHLRGDSALTAGAAWDRRGIYNCLINAQAVPAAGTARQATTLDLFPTTLSALGFTVPGDRLGLGVDLFSSQRTLAESMGYRALDSALEARSAFYLKHFAPELLEESR